jgi:hypothetical protein
MKPTAIDLYTDIYSALLDARFSEYNEERYATAQEALKVAYRRLAALEGMLLLINPTEELSAKPETPVHKMTIAELTAEPYQTEEVEF